MKLDPYDKKYATALRRGYLFGYINKDKEWADTFVGKWVVRYPQLTKCLDIICNAIGNSNPAWEEFTDSNIKAIISAITDEVSSNSARTYAASIKAILNDAKWEHDIPCKRYSELLRIKKEPSQSIFLTEGEIERIANYAPANEREQYVKCHFLMECYCGARHSDIHTFTDANIATDGTRKYISYVSQKTHVQADIPLHRSFTECLNGWNRDIVMYDDEFNDTLRHIGKRVGINEHTKLFRKGRWEEGEKWQFLTSHVGRKSFCSDLYLRGVDSKTISKLAGHTNQSITEQTYIVPMRGISDEAMAFFN